MGADSSAENTPNVPKFICPNFNKKRLHWASEVRGHATVLSSHEIPIFPIHNSKFPFFNSNFRSLRHSKTVHLYVLQLYKSNPF